MLFDSAILSDEVIDNMKTKKESPARIFVYYLTIFLMGCLITIQFTQNRCDKKGVIYFFGKQYHCSENYGDLVAHESLWD